MDGLQTWFGSVFEHETRYQVDESQDDCGLTIVEDRKKNLSLMF